MKRAAQKNLARSCGVTIFDEGEFIYENAQPEDFTPLPQKDSN